MLAVVDHDASKTAPRGSVTDLGARRGRPAKRPALAAAEVGDPPAPTASQKASAVKHLAKRKPGRATKKPKT